MPANLAIELVGDLMLLVHNNSTPTDTEWSQYVEVTLKMVRMPSGGRQLVLSDGGAPNLEQRRTVARAVEGVQEKPVPVAVVSKSAFVRFVVSALTISNPDIRVFSPAQMAEAYRYLKIEDPSDVERRLEALRAKIAREEKTRWRPFRRKRREEGQHFR